MAGSIINYMPNIEVQLCGLVFDLILLFFMLRNEVVGLYSEKIFKRCLIIYTVSLILDITSIYAIKYSNAIPGVIVGLICKAYFISLMTSALFGFIYTCSDVLHLRESESFKKGVMFFSLFGAMLIMCLPVRIYHVDRIIYSYGPSANATYFFAPLFIILSLITTFLYSKQMNPHRRIAIRFWMIIELLFAMIQFFIPEALIVGFGSSIGLFILYSELENPKAYLDKLLGCFSMDTLKAYLSQNYSDIRHFSSIIICNGKEWKMGKEDEIKVLVKMSEILSSMGNSKLFRLSGNDFILVYDSSEEHTMNEMESAENLEKVKELFKANWGDSHIVNTKFLYVPDSHIASSFDEFIDLYMRYKDTIPVHEDTRILDVEDGKDIRAYNEMVLEIKDALANDRIEVFYQPIYAINTGKFVSAEALARIRGLDGKLLMPGRFIPVAEETGLIEQIGERVFEKACKCIIEDGLREKGIEYVEVNLSVSQCENPMLHMKYNEIMQNIGVKPSDVSLEITESSTLNHRHVLLDNMNKLMNLGCSFALDDFGTGESNLNYIVDMPVKIVKFDRSMVQDYFTNEKARVVMASTVGMIKQLGLKIVAEGVETIEQYNGIKDLGIDYIQGYYFSKPLSKNEFVDFISKKNHIAA